MYICICICVCVCVYIYIYSCCCCSVTKSCRLFETPWTTAHQAFLSLTISQSLPKFMDIELVMPSNHLILLSFSSAFNLPRIKVFSSESAVFIRWPKYWSFIFSIIPSNKYSGLISFRIDWFDLFAVQGTLKSLLQHHSLKASVLQHSCLLHGPALTCLT